MNDITIFNFEGSGVRVLMDRTGEPWWVARDVCDVLGLADTSMSVQPLDDDEKLTQVLLVSGQKREMWTVNEPGLYTLIIRSNKPEAKKFKRWITHDVIPSIRKTGAYTFCPDEAFPNLLAVNQYLQKKGLKIGPRKIYVDHHKGLIFTRSDGTVLRSEAERYMKSIAEGQDQKKICRLKSAIELNEIRAIRKKAADSVALTKLFHSKLSLAMALGMSSAEAILVANKQVKGETGIDCIAQCGAEDVVARRLEKKKPRLYKNALESGLFDDFIEDECVVDPLGRVGCTVLYERFQQWIADMPCTEKPISRNDFASRANQRFERGKSGPLHYYRGIRLANQGETS